MKEEEYNRHTQLIEDNYLIVFSNKNNLKKYHIGKKDNKTCRFCGESKPKVTFNTIAHAIPECLGNKNIICIDECDECNKKFSENIEIHLDKITLRYRNINMIKGKKKIPSYRSNDKKVRIDVLNKEERLAQVIASSDSNTSIFDKNTNTLTQEYDIPSYIPSLAYKALVKMALSIMDNSELDRFKLLNFWIQDTKESIQLGFPLHVIFTFIPAINPFRTTWVLLLKKIKEDNEEYLSYMFVLAFGNIMYQIAIPSDVEITEKGKSKKILRVLPSFELDSNLESIEYQILDWSQTTVLESHKDTMTFFAGNRIELPNLKGVKLTDLPKNLKDLESYNK